MPPARRTTANGPVRIVRSSVRDMISDGLIQRLGLHRGEPLRPTAEDIAAYEEEAARREGQVPEVTSQAVLPLPTAHLLEDDVASTPTPGKSKAAREGDVAAWKARCDVPTAPCERSFGGSDCSMEEKQLEARLLHAEAFAKCVKHLPRRKPVKKQMPSVWLPKLTQLGSRSPQQAFTQDADSQETQTLDLFH